ncbi:MAG TPA: nicotinamidase [Candidatus Hydrogenedentes bacterium]|nr:nicotinamidase [Candidatus Hydrogenedentota bacterium]
MKVLGADALIVVDVQCDFCPGGALPVKGGDEIVGVINDLLPKFDHWFYTRDWHPEGHCSFAEDPEFRDGSWPVHCVRNTPGAAFHPDLHVPEGAVVINKPSERDTETYNGYQGTDLAERLRRSGVARVFVCGLATDYCVRSTALASMDEGFQTVLLEDACRAVDVPEGTGAQAVDEMRRAGVRVCRSEELA